MPITKKRNHFLYPGLSLGSLEGADVNKSETTLDAARIAIYIGVPYCRVQCFECPFFSSYLPGQSRRDAEFDAYFAAVRTHAAAVVQNLGLAGTNASLYIGGGTPTVVDPAYLHGVLSVLVQAGVSIGELTVEGNPENISEAYVEQVLNFGATRISLGVQSLDDSVLAAVGSPHRSHHTGRAVAIVKESGLDLNVDLMYGVPNQTPEAIQASMQWALERAAQGITWYAYTFQPEGIMTRRRPNRYVAAPRHVKPDEYYPKIREVMSHAGYYEGMIGAFHLPGHELQYSSIAYRQANRIVGLGAKAYTYDGAGLYQAPSEPIRYVDEIQHNAYPFADRYSGALSRSQICVRETILGLMYGEIARRTLDFWGVVPAGAGLNKLLAEWRRMGAISADGDGFKLTEFGAIVLDDMLTSLWRVPQ